ncbi:hypothetical protein Tco_0739870 [Tanacetum coccineum]
MIGDLWVEAVIPVKGLPWVGDGGVSGVSLSVVSSSDDKNGEIAGNGGIWSDDGSSDGSGSESDADAGVYRGKQWGHIPGVGRVLPGQGTVISPPPPCTHSSNVAKLKKSEKRLTKQVKMFMKLCRSDDKFFQMLTQLESQPEYGGGCGSGGCGDDEPGDDEDGDEDEEDEEDG